MPFPVRKKAKEQEPSETLFEQDEENQELIESEETPAQETDTEPKRSFAKFHKETKKGEEKTLIEKIQALYKELSPKGKYHNAVNYEVYETENKARFLLQTANDLIAETKEILKEIIDKYKYDKELF